MNSSLLYVIILNWNRPADTLACLQAAYRSNYPNFQVVVVDNASVDDSTVQIQAEFPQTLLLKNHTNLGYAGGNNKGIRYGLDNGAAYVILLNDDVLVEEDTFTHFVDAATPPDVAAAGCKVRIFENPQRLWAAGECFPRGRPYPLDDGRFDTRRDIRYAVGCCILLCSTALQDVGLLDAEYFAVHEEKDWCCRALEAGYRIVYVPDAVVKHKLSGSFTTHQLAVYHYLFTRNQLRFIERHTSGGKKWRRFSTAGWVWQEELRYISRHGEDRLRRSLGATRGMLDYLRGHFGPPPTL